MSKLRVRKFLPVGVVFYLLAPLPTAAQIVPDNTLPNNSLVTSDGNTNIINGGTKAGNNLFHSFEQFSVPTGGEAFFNNAADIQNIISRVTGASVSNIDGLIRANSTANLFLLNPNGIVFGPHARLNIGGSFLASTATSLNFADGNKFSATNPQTTPLLTVSIPIGLDFRSNSGGIRVQGTGHDLRFSAFLPTTGRNQVSSSLQVQLGKTLALIGGDVSLEGAVLRVEGGQIELGSVGEGIVNINATPVGWSFGYEGVFKSQAIHLSRQTLVDASGIIGGSIQVNGNIVSLREGSMFLIQNQGRQLSGSIRVNAFELEVNGTTVFTPNSFAPSSLLTEASGSW